MMKTEIFRQILRRCFLIKLHTHITLVSHILSVILSFMEEMFPRHHCHAGIHGNDNLMIHSYVALTHEGVVN